MDTDFSSTDSPRFEHADALSVIRRWVALVNEGRARDVAALYSNEALLLPTFSPHALVTDAGRIGYFETLATRQGMQVSMHEKTLRIRSLTDEIKVASGIYRFSFEIDEEPLTFEARFTCVMDMSLEQPIQHHHSSQVPRTLG